MRMCLFTRQICPIKARKDIVCYKLLSVIPNTINVSFDRYLGITEYTKRTGKRPKYLTPYQAYLVEDIPTKLETHDKTDLRKIKYDELHCEIRGGMFHAFTKRILWTLDRVVVKCIIPKGTLYFKGINNDICAKTLILQEIVEPGQNE